MIETPIDISNPGLNDGELAVLAYRLGRSLSDVQREYRARHAKQSVAEVGKAFARSEELETLQRKIESEQSEALRLQDEWIGLCARRDAIKVRLQAGAYALTRLPQLKQGKVDFLEANLGNEEFGKAELLPNHLAFVSGCDAAIEFTQKWMARRADELEAVEKEIAAFQKRHGVK